MSSSQSAASQLPWKLLVGFRGLPPMVWLLSVIVLMGASGRMVTTFLAVYLSTVLALSEQQIGLLVGAYGAGVVTGSLLGGWTASRLPAVLQMAACLSLSGIGFIWLSALTDITALLVGVFICANFEGGLRPPTTLLFLKACRVVDRPRSHAVYYTANGLGYAVGAAAGGLLSQVDFSLLFWASGSASMAAAATALWSLKAHIAERILPDAPQAGSAVQCDGAPQSHWPFIALCGGALLYYCVANQRLATYPLYLTSHYGLDGAELGAIFMLNGVLIAASGILVTGWVKHVDQRRVASAGALLLCGGFALLPVSTHIEFAFLLCVVMSAGDVLFVPSSVALAYSLAPRRREGSRLGIFFATVAACRSLGPLIGIWSFAAFGETVSWLLCGALGIVSVAFLRCSAGRPKAVRGIAPPPP